MSGRRWEQMGNGRNIFNLLGDGLPGGVKKEGRETQEAPPFLRSVQFIWIAIRNNKNNENNKVCTDLCSQFIHFVLTPALPE